MSSTSYLLGDRGAEDIDFPWVLKKEHVEIPGAK